LGLGEKAAIWRSSKSLWRFEEVDLSDLFETRLNSFGEIISGVVDIQFVNISALLLNSEGHLFVFGKFPTVLGSTTSFGPTKHDDEPSGEIISKFTPLDIKLPQNTFITA